MKNALMDVLKRRLLWYAVLGCLLFCLGIHFYTQWDIARFEAEMPPVPRRLTSDTTVKTPGDISLETETETQDGHFHEDGTWHAAPHAPVEVSEAEVSDDVQGAPVGAQQANTQREAPMQASDADTQTDIDINRAWIEWGNKHLELAKKRSQAGKEIIAAMPATEAELERFENDPEWQRKLNEALHKAAKIDAMLKVFEQEKPARP